MPLDQLQLRDVFPAAPERIYELWMDSEGHALMTGGEAVIDPREGGEFRAWDGYITGVTERLEPGRLIVQRWRTSEFPEDAGDSMVELTLRPVEGGCEITLVHSGIPEGQGDRYKSGWVDYYFEPLRELLEGISEEAAEAIPAAQARSIPIGGAKPKKAAKKKAKKAAKLSKKPARKAAMKKTSPKAAIKAVRKSTRKLRAKKK
jgi:uncharacterized protein YndB with AHSA1/START domain